VKVLVIGGGISGISAAKVLLGLGAQVILVEKEEAPGGLMSKIANCRIGFQRFFSEIAGHEDLKIFVSCHVKKVRSEGNGFNILLSNGERLHVDKVIIAAGALPYKPQPSLFPNSARVMTSLEFDKIIDQKTSEIPPDMKKICFILCVGSREKEFPLCSGVCCSYALRQIKWLFQREEGVSVTVFYNDLRLAGQEFYLQELFRHKGVKFLRTTTRAITPLQNKVRVKYYTAEGFRSDEFDYVILSVGLRPNPDLRTLSGLFGFSLNEHGFVREIRPLQTDREGVFAAGCALEPMNIKDSISTGLGAAWRCLEGEEGLPVLKVQVDDQKYEAYLEDIGLEAEEDAPLRLICGQRPPIPWKDEGGPYLFLLDLPEVKGRFASEYISLLFIERAIELRQKGQRVYIVNSSVITPCYDELLYEKARRMGVIFLHLEEGGALYKEAKTIYRAEDLLEVIADKEYLIQYRSEPQLRFTPHKWDRTTYLFGFLRYPRSARWGQREFYSALAELLLEQHEEVTVPEVETGRCSGCELCLRACPHGAIKMVQEKSTALTFGPFCEKTEFFAQIESSSCQGCGLCANVCPSEAIKLEEVFYGF